MQPILVTLALALTMPTPSPAPELEPLVFDILDTHGGAAGKDGHAAKGGEGGGAVETYDATSFRPLRPLNRYGEVARPNANLPPWWASEEEWYEVVEQLQTALHSTSEMLMDVQSAMYAFTRDGLYDEDEDAIGVSIDFLSSPSPRLHVYGDNALQTYGDDLTAVRMFGTLRRMREAVLESYCIQVVLGTVMLFVASAALTTLCTPRRTQAMVADSSTSTPDQFDKFNDDDGTEKKDAYPVSSERVLSV